MAHERITIDPDQMSGLLCIWATRVTVSAVLGQLAAARSVEEVLVDYPFLLPKPTSGAVGHSRSRA